MPGCWLCFEVPAVKTLPNGMHVCEACAPEPDPSLHTWDGEQPEVARDEDGAPIVPCPGWDWAEDDDAE